MIFIAKNQEPAFLTEFKRKYPSKTYDSDEFSDYRSLLNDYLRGEQKGLCAYCCAHIETGRSHNEHIEPQHPGKYSSNKSLDYGNIVASCNNKNTCGKKKENVYDAEKFVSPLEEDCESKFVYYLDGTIEGDDYTIDLLNHIQVSKVKTSYGYAQNSWLIDEKPLAEYLNDLRENLKNDEYINFISNFADLYPAWGMELLHEGEIRFVWKLIHMDSAVVPLFVCENDLDLSCIVIVAEIEKTEDFVYWNRIGYVLHDNENIEEEMKSGISKVEVYTDEDWEKYGDNIALECTGSLTWRKWISENWSEELYRRRMNYTLPYYMTEENICWLTDMKRVFDRNEYEDMVDLFWNLETLEKLQKIDKQKTIHTDECAKMISELEITGRDFLEQHIKDFGEILLHVLASDFITEPLIEMLKKADDKRDYGENRNSRNNREGSVKNNLTKGNVTKNDINRDDIYKDDMTEDDINRGDIHKDDMIEDDINRGNIHKDDMTKDNINRDDIHRNNIKIQIYCRLIEIMWYNGDDTVKNVVEVTILERISDDDKVWKRFCETVSDEFKRVIH